MRNRIVLAIAVVVVLVTPIAAYAASFLDIRLATVTTSSSQQKVDKATLLTRASIPKDGNAGAFGYGILTDQGVIIVTTTHKGVLDSAAQNGNANNPIFHNHYVTLRADNRCGDDPAVFQISFDSPGKVTVAGSVVSLKDLPKSSNNPTLSQNNHVPEDGVKSFQLEPKNGAVCVTHIQTADRIAIK